MHSRRPSGSSAVAATPPRASRKGARGAAASSKHASTDAVVVWTSHPARLHPSRAAIAFLAAAFVWWVALAAFREPLMAVVGSLAIVGSLTEALFPVHHRLTASGASTRCAWQIRQMNWDSVKCAYTGSDGIHLSPMRSGSRLGKLRGVTLRFAGGDRDEIAAAVRRRLGRDQA